MKLLLLSGSLRSRSSNTELLRAAMLVAGNRFAFAWFDRLAELPHFNPDQEERGELGTAADLRRAVAEADAVIICSPEYAHGVPGSLKNALDWLVGGPEMVGRKVALWQASTGLAYAPVQLRETLRTMSAIVCDAASVTLSLRGGSRDAASIAADPTMATLIVQALAALTTMTVGETDGN